jgi:hypothetical protein
MEDAFQLLDPHEAKAFLKNFDTETRRRGEALFRTGKVRDLAPVEAGLSYTAEVGTAKPYHVELVYDEDEGWEGDCACDDEFQCEHIFAAMRALLAEHSTAVVRNLSASVPSAIAAAMSGARQEKKGAETESETLARKLLTALQRPLTAAETKFIRKVHAVYTRCCQARHITRWDFQEMGLSLGGYGWDALQIWPAFPANEHEFWLYVAHTAREHMVKCPEFMEPVTDLAGIRERLAHWQRSREIERWKQKLGNLEFEPSAPAAAGQKETDLRLVIGEKEAGLQWRPTGQETFQSVKTGELQQLARDHEHGVVQFSPPSELLWEHFSQRLYLGVLQLRYDSGFDTMRTLGRILRTHLLNDLIVNPSGEVLARPLEPLRWELECAGSSDDDYRLRLVMADGKPAPPILCTLPGKPTLYLSQDAVFTGPAPQSEVLDPSTVTSIPAPALERGPGVAFLQALGLELPPRVRERVRTLPLQVAISCDLQPIYQGSKTEDCMVTVVAEAPDGHQEIWTGQSWVESGPGSRRKADRRDAAIILYDRAALAPVPMLLAPLNLKANFYGNKLLTRVSRKFPELFAAWLKSVPPEITVHLAGDLASFATPDIAGRVKLDVSEAGIDWFDLRVVLDVTDATLTPEEIKILLNARGNYVRLAGKGWRRLHFDVSEEENERLARLGLSTRELSAEPQRLHALQLADEAAKKFLPAQQVEQIQRRAEELKARVAPDLPSGVTAQLRPYQLEGFHFLAYLSVNRFGGILADDMGLGKTLQALAWILWLRSPAPNNGAPAGQPGIPPSLVVCPKSVMDNWHAEAARFTSGLRVKVWPASDLATFLDRLAEADLHVINYSQLRSLGESLVPLHWLAVILDEGQYIKNPSSQTAQVARALKADHRLVLSGTPIENRLLDLWSLMSFAMPGVLSSRAQFARLYDAKGDPFARRRLSSRVRPFLLRRTKAQVAKDLPDRIEEDLFCEIEGEQKTLYRAELKRAQQLLLHVKTQKELAQQQFHFLTSLLRLRQICCHPKLVSPDSNAVSAKSEALLEQLEPLIEEGNKVLVFSQFVQLLGLLRPALAERKWPVFYLAGDTENRGKLVEQFQTKEGAAVFLISLKAGGFGLNLTAASYVVLFDPWWNPAVEAQAIDRTHRIGQVNKVIAYRLLIKDSIEEKIRELQKQKKALADDVLGEERFAQSLTLDDLQYLFADGPV